MPQEELKPLRETLERQRCLLANLQQARATRQEDEHQEDHHQEDCKQEDRYQDDHHQVQEDEHDQPGKFAYLPITLKPNQYQGIFHNTKTKCYIISPRQEDVKYR